MIHLIIMTTTKKRLNITLSKQLNDILLKLSKRDEVPQATKATELLRMAVEMEEDYYFDKIASKRDTRDAKFISHDEAWN